jgi:hypothetical protein
VCCYGRILTLQKNLMLSHWRWWHHGPPKRWYYVITWPYAFITQKTTTCISIGTLLTSPWRSQLENHCQVSSKNLNPKCYNQTSNCKHNFLRATVTMTVRYVKQAKWVILFIRIYLTVLEFSLPMTHFSVFIQVTNWVSCILIFSTQDTVR